VSELFQKLFRQDLMVASLFRNYLLAERILKTLGCSPVTYPRLPSTHQHSMWEAWDHAVDWCFSQLPALMNASGSGSGSVNGSASASASYEYRSSAFFADQLTAFEVWLEYGNEASQPPEQLPIVLQVLLSQTHRLRALQLLGRFLDLGPWAVNLALSVGIFPYVLKLLQSPALELRQILVLSLSLTPNPHPNPNP
jgi:regulatory associated protein of mTOR